MSDSPLEPKTWAHIAVASLVGNLIPYFLFGWGEERVDSAVAGTLNATTPLFTLAIAFATRTETTITRERACGFLLGFLGAVLLVAPWNSAGISATGALACLAAAASYGVSYVYMRRYLTGRGTNPIALAVSRIRSTRHPGLYRARLADQAVDLQLAVYENGGRMPNPLLMNIREDDFDRVKVVITSSNRDEYEEAITNGGQLDRDGIHRVRRRAADLAL